LVLVVVAVLALGTGTYLQLMQTELRAVRQHGRIAQAARLAESGVEYLKATLALPPAEIQEQGGLASNPALMQGLTADDQPSEFDRGRFTVICPAQVDGRYAGVRYGLENESGKLNLNTLLAEGAEEQAPARLMALPGMTPEIADAILDWLDADATPRPLGAEGEAYGSLTPPYAPRNGPLASLDELLLVRGVTPELLYGLDQNRNFVVDADETARGALTEVDNSEGYFNRGWSAYLTLTSVENVGPQPGAVGGPANVNDPNLQSLYNSLKSALTDEQAKFIILYRQYGGAPSGATAGGNAGTAPGGQPAQAAAPAGTASTASTASARPAGSNSGRPGGAGANPTATVSAATIDLKFDQQPSAEINSLLDLIGAQVQIPAADQNSQPQTVASPWRDEPGTYGELPRLYDAVVPGTTGGANRIAGRVNLNAASRPVLRSIPGLSLVAVNQIVARRELEPDRALSDQRHVIWPLLQGIVTLEQMRALERFVTAGGDAFSGQVVGFFDAGPTVSRGEFVVERSSPTPRLRQWRDMGPWGPGYAPGVLGALGAAGR